MLRGYDLVAQQLSEESPPRIADVLGQLTVTDHPCDPQRLDPDGLFFADKASREFMKMVPTLVRDMGMQFGDLEALFITVVGSFLTPREATLEASETAFGLDQVAGVSDLLSGGQSGIGRQTDIDPDGPRPSGLFGHVLTGEDRPVASIGGTFDTALGDLVRWQRSMPDDLEGLRVLPKIQRSAVDLVRLVRVDRSALVIALGLEARVAAPLLEKALVGLEQPGNDLLQNLCWGLREPQRGFFLFPERQLST